MVTSILFSAASPPPRLRACLSIFGAVLQPFHGFSQQTYIVWPLGAFWPYMPMYSVIYSFDDADSLLFTAKLHASLNAHNVQCFS